jgi:glycosyltransferase involved in cell wall biosynthesis
LSSLADDRPLRILHVTEAFGGGVLEMIATLAGGAAAAGDEVAIAYGRRPETPADPRTKIDAAVELIPLGWERRTIGAQLSAWRRLRRIVAERRPDVVHLHSSFAGLAGALALPRSLPTVYTPHGYSFTMRDQRAVTRHAFRAVERLTARGAAVVGAVSEAEAATAREVAPASKVVVVRNGVPELDGLDPDAPLPERPGRPKAIALGRITAQHMPEASARILAAVADVADVEWVGGGGRGDIPVEVVTELGVPVTGWVERGEAMERLHGATALLHWTAWDGQPLSILEAMAADVVVVGHDIDAVREMVGPERVGSEETAGAALLRRALTDSEWRADALASQRRRRAVYGAERMVAEWLAIYRRLAARSALSSGKTENVQGPATGDRSSAPYLRSR